MVEKLRGIDAERFGHHRDRDCGGEHINNSQGACYPFAGKSKVKILTQPAVIVVAAGQPGVRITGKHSGNAGDDKSIIGLFAGQQDNLSEQSKNPGSDNRADTERDNPGKVHVKFMYTHFFFFLCRM